MIVVADTSPLVALRQISLLSIIPSLFGVVLIPPAVAQEAISVDLEPWLVITPLQKPVPDAVHRAGIGRGETEAISLAIEVRATQIILDDFQARRLATSIRLSIVGTMGLLLAAKKNGLIPNVRKPMDDLLVNRFRLHPDVYRTILARAGEAPAL